METNPDSAYIIITKINPNFFRSESEKALYGLLLFEYLDKKDKILQPDSLINFSTNYYLKQNDKKHLLPSLYLQARVSKKEQRFDEASDLYIKLEDFLSKTKDYYLLGRVNFDMGEISSIQRDYKKSRFHFIAAYNYFLKSGDIANIRKSKLSIGRTYRFTKEYSRAKQYFYDVLKEKNDSLIYGSACQEIGILFYQTKNYDSAKHYLRQSLNYPYEATNYCIRCITYSDLMYDLKLIDSTAKYAKLSLKFPGTFFNRRECYRILVNVEYLRNDIKKMGQYMTMYQNYTDSVRKIEIQTKSTILENLHQSENETKGTKSSLLYIWILVVMILLSSVTIVYSLYKRNKNKKAELIKIKQQLNLKQEFVNQSLFSKIEETRRTQAQLRKNATSEERLIMDKELYSKTMHLNNWELFSKEMNHAFNNIVDKLQINYPNINQKEIMWCCFQLLNIPMNDRILLLETTSDGVYKIKQRIAHKFNLIGTKQLEIVLKELTSSN